MEHLNADDNWTVFSAEPPPKVAKHIAAVLAKQAGSGKACENILQRPRLVVQTFVIEP